MLNELELTGRAATHVVQRDDLKAALHGDALEPFLAMKAAAADHGIALGIASGFRDFAAQQRIWDRKFRGERPLYDSEGNVLDAGSLSAPERLEAIACWSAVPGSSRHHWGSEIDAIDLAALGDGDTYRLVPSEYQPEGIFARLGAWLDAHMSQFGFFRPYRTFRGGVQPEPWHLSYAPVSIEAHQQLTPDLFARALAASDIEGRALLLERAADIHARYVANVDAPAATLLAAGHGSMTKRPSGIS